MDLKVREDFIPKGDQAPVIDAVSKGIIAGEKFQTIIGATGTGKTYVMAKIIEAVQRPTLILCHNKTLAAQLYREFSHFFPENDVSYFVSYYDYYQPEAYVVKKNLYIEKDSSVNEEIDQMRLKATASLMYRRDVIIVASVSCIYGLGSPDDYKSMHLILKKGETTSRGEIIKKLIDIQYERNDDAPDRGMFRVRGDIVDIFPAYSNGGFRIELFGDEVERLSEIDRMNNSVSSYLDNICIYPAKHFVMSADKVQPAIDRILEEMEEHCTMLEANGKRLEAERLRGRTQYDMEMLATQGFCSGVENYSRHLSGRAKGETPSTLFDYFPDDFLLFVDESHVTLPQVHGMYNGDQSRKQSLVEYGFRLPSALDNRPLFFEEFVLKAPHYIFVSATPGQWERDISTACAELINRPTGLLDPIIEVRPSEGQIDDLLSEINKTIAMGFRVLVTTLTKKMSEDLTTYLKDHQIKTSYLHSDIDTIERVEILMDLRSGKVDVLVGINLLREGLDLPEVALVAILDADKIGFLRSKSALIQTSGRASRNQNGRVIMYGDRVSDAMQGCIDETKRRRLIQENFNRENDIVPTTIVKALTDILDVPGRKGKGDGSEEKNYLSRTKNASDAKKEIKTLEFKMKLAADEMNFEEAIAIREQIRELKKIFSI